MLKVIRSSDTTDARLVSKYQSKTLLSTYIYLNPCCCLKYYVPTFYININHTTLTINSSSFNSCFNQTLQHHPFLVFPIAASTPFHIEKFPSKFHFTTVIKMTSNTSIQLPIASTRLRSLILKKHISTL